jgi:hypothetical protein
MEGCSMGFENVIVPAQNCLSWRFGRRRSAACDVQKPQL